MNTLSFVVPVYNVENYISQCLTSILNQIETFPGSEIIVVNDGTKDNSMKIVEELSQGKDYVRIIHQPNGGLSKARNTGLEAAHCEYVWFIDSDDWLLDDALQHVKKAMQQAPSCDLYVSGLQWVYPNNHTRVDITHGPKFYDNGVEYLKAKNMMGASPRFIIRRSILMDNDVRFPEGLLHEDGYFGHVMPIFARGVYIMDNPVYAYRQREEGSIMHSVSIKNAYDSIKNHQLLIAFAESQLTGELQQWFILSCRDIIAGLYSFIKPLYYTPEYKKFYTTHKEYIKSETLRCIALSDSIRSKARLWLFYYSPRFSVYVSSAILTLQRKFHSLISHSA